MQWWYSGVAINRKRIVSGSHTENFNSESLTNLAENANNDVAAQQLNASLISKSQMDSASTTSMISIQKPMLFSKIKPPQNQFKTMCSANAVNPTQLLKTIETSMEPIGLGINNCLTKNNIDLKIQLTEKAFNLQLNEDSVNQLIGVTNFDQVKM